MLPSSTQFGVHIKVFPKIKGHYMFNNRVRSIEEPRLSVRLLYDKDFIPYFTEQNLSISFTLNPNLLKPSYALQLQYDLKKLKDRETESILFKLAEEVVIGNN